MLRGDVVREPVTHPGGIEPVDDRPGLGVELDAETFAAAHRRFREEGYLSAYAEGRDEG